MTQSEANLLFSKYDFATAKSLLIDEAHRNGVDVDEVNASIFELMAAACGSGTSHSKSSSHEYKPIDEEAHGSSESETANKGDGNGERGDFFKDIPTDGGSDGGNEEETDDSNDYDPSAAAPKDDGKSNGDDSNADADGNEQSGESESDQSNEQSKRKRNTPKWKEIAEKMREEMEKQKKEMTKQIEDAKAESKEPSSVDEMERKARELLEKAEAIREEERKRREEEEKKRKEAMSNNKHHLTDEMIKRLKCLGIVMLSGPAGSGKSSLAMQACKEMFNIKGDFYDVIRSGKFAQISFSPDTMSADMLGFTDVNGVYHETDIVKVFRDGGIMLFDEVDSADPSVFTKLNTMVANGTVPTPNGVVTRHPEAYFVWTGNTWGTGANAMYCGRNRLDAASLDRVTCATIYVDYDDGLERSICLNNGLDEVQTHRLLGVTKLIRNLIANNKWKRLCSTRFVINGSKMMKAGYDLQFILDAFLSSWDDHDKNIVKTSCNGFFKSK